MDATKAIEHIGITKEPEEYVLNISITGIEEMQKKVMELQKTLERAKTLANELADSKVTITRGKSGLIVRNPNR